MREQYVAACDDSCEAEPNLVVNSFHFAVRKLGTAFQRVKVGIARTHAVWLMMSVGGRWGESVIKWSLCSNGMFTIVPFFLFRPR